MKMHLLVCVTTCALALAAGPVLAKISIDSDHCDIDSEYSVQITAEHVAFTNDKTHQVVALLPGGIVQVDGLGLVLDAGDRAHVLEMERGVRELVPEAKSLAVEAIGVAFEALAHASTAFAANAHEARESAQRIARTARELERSINARDNWGANSEDEIEDLIEGAVGALVGEMVGNITAQAIKVALSGDEAAVAELEARADSIGSNVEKAIEKSAKRLEKRADNLCLRVRELDRTEAQISARLADGSTFDLIHVQR